MTNQAGRRRYARRRSGVGTGTTSLLMIFTVLCFATLAMLSLSTAASNNRIQTRGLEGQRLLAVARGAAATEVASLDEALYQLQQDWRQNPGPDARQRYYEEALSIATTRGWLAYAGEETLSMRIPIDDASELVTTLELLPPDDAARYEVLSQVSELNNGWQPEEDGRLWIPS